MQSNDRNREEQEARLLELGTASTETHGGLGNIIEPMGLWHKLGISDE